MRCHRCCSARLRRLPPAASDPAAPPSTRRGLTLPVQIGYAFAEIGQNLVETAIRIYLLIYYTDVVGLNARLAGIAVGLSLVWDACIDPVMGAISDRTRHRFAYVAFGLLRKPFFVIGFRRILRKSDMTRE